MLFFASASILEHDSEQDYAENPFNTLVPSIRSNYVVMVMTVQWSSNVLYRARGDLPYKAR